MEITLLCIGDVVGRPGRTVVSQAVPKLVRQYSVDCVIANLENAAAGSGLTVQLYHKYLRYGVHLMTMGDHIYRKAELMPILEQSDRIVRPANYPAESVGQDCAIFQCKTGPKIAVVSIMGRLFMHPPCDCPFHAIDRVMAKMPHDVKIVVVDMHAEATSEKIAMGWYLNGRVSVLFGTHTHVATADEQILDGGTAYITDLGMTGPHDGVLGRRKDRVIRAITTGLPSPFDVAIGDPKLCGIIVRVNAETGKASHIERVSVNGIPPDQEDEEAE